MTDNNPLRIHLERMLLAQEGVPLNAVQFGQWVKEARAALAAAPQPAPVEPLREALVKVIELAMGSDDEWSPEMRQEATHIADALLAAGLRLPVVQPAETLAWGIIRKDGEIIAGGLRSREIVERGLRDGERIVRVAIRRVEDKA